MTFSFLFWQKLTSSLQPSAEPVAEAPQGQQQWTRSSKQSPRSYYKNSYASVVSTSESIIKALVHSSLPVEYKNKNLHRFGDIRTTLGIIIWLKRASYKQ